MSEPKRKISQLPTTSAFGASDRLLVRVAVGGGVFANKIISKAAFIAALEIVSGEGSGVAQYVQSPNGHYWELTMSDDGILSYNDIGDTLP